MTDLIDQIKYIENVDINLIIEYDYKDFKSLSEKILKYFDIALKENEKINDDFIYETSKYFNSMIKCCLRQNKILFDHLYFKMS